MNSERKKKLIIIIILFILLILIIFNMQKIKFALGIYNIYAEQKNEIIESGNVEPDIKVEIYNPLTSIIETENDIKGEDPLITQPITEEKESKDKKQEEQSKIKPTNDIKTPVTISKEKIDNIKPYMDIVKEYNLKFESLRSTFESELEGLINQGIIEYQSGEISSTKLSSNYLSSGTKLEKSSDVIFNSLVKEMENELKSNSHDLKVIGEIKSYYSDFKNSTKRDVISRGLKHLK